MTGFVAMNPGTLRDAAGRCREVARQARAVERSVGGLPEPEGLPPEAGGLLREAAAQLRRSAASADRQSAWLIHRAQKGLFADSPWGDLSELNAPPLLTPWFIPPPPEKPLKVPDPAQSLLGRILGRNYVLPEEAANVVLENGVDPTKFLKVLGLGGRGAAKRTRIAKPPGGGLKAHEGRGGHTIEKHVGKTVGDLRARLRTEPGIKAASSFKNRELAEDAVAGVLKINARWIKQMVGRNGEAAFTQSFDRSIGTVVTRAGAVSATKQVTVVVVKDSSKLGYHVKTAYPS